MKKHIYEGSYLTSTRNAFEYLQSRLAYYLNKEQLEHEIRDAISEYSEEEISTKLDKCFDLEIEDDYEITKRLDTMAVLSAYSKMGEADSPDRISDLKKSMIQCKFSNHDNSTEEDIPKDADKTYKSNSFLLTL